MTAEGWPEWRARTAIDVLITTISAEPDSRALDPGSSPVRAMRGPVRGPTLVGDHLCSQINAMQELAVFDQILGSIYDAALDPVLWPDAIGKAVGYVGGAAGCLIMRDSASQAGAIFHGAGDQPRYRQLYLDQYAALDPGESLFFCQDVGTVLHYPDFIPRSELVASPFYQEFMLPQGWADGLFASLAKHASSVFAFAMARHVDDDTPYEVVRDRVARLVPHLRRAALIGDPATFGQRRTRELSETLDGLAAAVFIVTRGRRLLHANSAGDIMLNRRSPLRLTAGRLIADEKGSDDCLDLCLAMTETKAGMERGAPASVSIIDASGAPYVVHAIPLVADSGVWDCAPVTARVALFVHTVAEPHVVPKEALARHYGFTPTELRVFCAIVEVGGVPEAAAALGIADSTVKTHLHRIFAKTGATRQADLAGLFARFASPFRSS